MRTWRAHRWPGTMASGGLSWRAQGTACSPPWPGAAPRSTAKPITALTLMCARTKRQPHLRDRINCLAFGQDYFCSEQDCYHLIENNYPMQIGFKLAGWVAAAVCFQAVLRSAERSGGVRGWGCPQGWGGRCGGRHSLCDTNPPQGDEGLSCPPGAVHWGPTICLPEPGQALDLP